MATSMNSYVSGAGAPGAAHPTDHGYANYIGAPTLDVSLNPMDGVPHTRENLAHYYNDKAIDVSELLDTTVVDQPSFLTTHIMPYMKTNQQNLRGSVWKFNQTMAGRVPHEGASRMIGSQRLNKSWSVVRRGLAFSMERDRFNGPDGAVYFRKNMNTVLRSIQNTQNADTLQAILRAPTMRRIQLANSASADAEYSTIILKAARQYAVLNKNRRLLPGVISEYMSDMRVRNANPRFLIATPGICSMLDGSHDPSRSKYYMFGPDGRLFERQGPAPFMVYQGLSVFKSEAYVADTADDNPFPATQMLHRDAMVGEFYQHKINPVVLDNLRHQAQRASNKNEECKSGVGIGLLFQMEKASFYSEMLDIEIYNMERDKFERIGFRDALSNSDLWDKNGQISPFIRDMAGKNTEGSKTNAYYNQFDLDAEEDVKTMWRSNAAGRNHRRDRHFMLAHRANGTEKVAQFWGELDHDVYNYRDLAAIGLTMSSHILGDMGDDEKQKLFELVILIARLHNERGTPAYWRALKDANTNHEAGTLYNVPAVDADTIDLPAGFGSFVGLRSLAKNDTNKDNYRKSGDIQRRKIGEYLNVLVRIYQAMYPKSVVDTEDDANKASKFVFDLLVGDVVGFSITRSTDDEDVWVVDKKQQTGNAPTFSTARHGLEAGLTYGHASLMKMPTARTGASIAVDTRSADSDNNALTYVDELGTTITVPHRLDGKTMYSKHMQMARFLGSTTSAMFTHLDAAIAASATDNADAVNQRIGLHSLVDISTSVSPRKLRIQGDVDGDLRQRVGELFVAAGGDIDNVGAGMTGVKPEVQDVLRKLATSTNTTTMQRAFDKCIKDTSVDVQRVGEAVAQGDGDAHDVVDAVRARDSSATGAGMPESYYAPDLTVAKLRDGNNNDAVEQLYPVSSGLSAGGHSTAVRVSASTGTTFDNASRPPADVENSLGSEGMDALNAMERTVCGDGGVGGQVPPPASRAPEDDGPAVVHFPDLALTTASLSGGSSSGFVSPLERKPHAMKPFRSLSEPRPGRALSSMLGAVGAGLGSEMRMAPQMHYSRGYDTPLDAGLYTYGDNDVTVTADRKRRENADERRPRGQIDFGFDKEELERQGGMVYGKTTEEVLNDFDMELVSPALAQRWQKAEQIRNPAVRLGAMMFLMRSTTAQPTLDMVEANVFLPLQVQTMRPFMEHTMENMVMCVGGMRQGINAIGNSHHSVHEDGNAGIVYVALTFTARALVFNSHYIEILENVKAYRYRAGCNCRWIDDPREVYNLTTTRGSLMSTVLPLHEEVGDVISTLGSFTKNNPFHPLATNMTEREETHFSSADVFERTWGLRDAASDRMQMASDPYATYFAREYQLNDVLCRGRHFVYDPVHNAHTKEVSSLSFHGNEGAAVGAKAAWDGESFEFNMHRSDFKN